MKKHTCSNPFCIEKVEFVGEFCGDCEKCEVCKGSGFAPGTNGLGLECSTCEGTGEYLEL